MSDAGRVRPHRSELSGGWGRVHTATQTPGISVEKHRRAAVLQPVSALLSARGLQRHRLHRCGRLCRYTVRSDHLQWVVMIQIPAEYPICCCISEPHGRCFCRVHQDNRFIDQYLNYGRHEDNTFSYNDSKKTLTVSYSSKYCTESLTRDSLQLKAFSRFYCYGSHQHNDILSRFCWLKNKLKCFFKRNVHVFVSCIILTWIKLTVINIYVFVNLQTV